MHFWGYSLPDAGFLSDMNRALLMAVVFMASGMSLIPIGDALAKAISGVSDYSPEFLAWSRFVVGSAIMLPLALFKGSFRGLGKRFYLRQAVRGLLIAMTLVFIITAVSLSPLADVFGAFFIGPVVATILAVILLKEQASWLEWLAVVLGFVGVLLVVQPGGAMSKGLLYALIAGLFYGSFLVATRWAAASGPPMAQLAAQLVFGLIFLAPLGFSDILNHGVQAGTLVVVMGLTSAAANFFSILALARARAAWLAPVVYLQIVVASIISTVVFKDPLNTLAIAGLVLIIFTGLLKLGDVMTHKRSNQS